MDSDPRARIYGAFWPALAASVHVTFLHREFLVPLLDCELTRHDGAEHVSIHQGFRSYRSGLKHGVAYLDALIAGDVGIPLADVYPPNTGGNLTRERHANDSDCVVGGQSFEPPTKPIALAVDILEISE